MTSRTRKSSTRVSLVLIGLATVAGCSKQPETKRDVYASKEDCLADWGHKEQDCTPATDRPRHSGGGFLFYGPLYAASAMNAWRGSNWSGSGARPGSGAIGSTAPSAPGGSSISRGGFGSSGHSASG